jgi:hypothetical protein
VGEHEIGLDVALELLEELLDPAPSNGKKLFSESP